MYSKLYPAKASKDNKNLNSNTGTVIGQKKMYEQAFRCPPNYSGFRCCMVPQMTSCCQETTPAGEEKYSANLLGMEKASLQEFFLPSRELEAGTNQAEFMDQTMILSQLCPPTPPLNPLLIVVFDFVWISP